MEAMTPALIAPTPIETKTTKKTGEEQTQTLLKTQQDIYDDNKKGDGNNDERPRCVSSSAPKHSPSLSATASSSQSPQALSSPSSPPKEEGDTVAELDESFRHQQEKHSNNNKFLLVVPPEDSFDDRSHDDPYIYSDDSGSLSDAYFFPQAHDAAAAAAHKSEFYSESDWKKYPSYGSLERCQSPLIQLHHHHTHHQQGLPSPVGLNGTTILEDSPATQATPLVPIRHSTRQYKKQQRRRHLVQRRLQEQRERAVTQIRGKPQPPTAHHDSFWLFLFVLQLLFVFGCAIRYGWTLVKPMPLFQGINVVLHTASSSSSSNGAATELLAMPSNKTFNINRKGSSDRTFSNNGNGNTTLAPMTFDASTASTPKDLKPLQDDDSFQQAPKSSTTGNSKIPSESTAPPETTTSTTTQDATFSIDYRNIIKLLIISGTYACIMSYLSFGFMLIVARSLIPIMLVFTILLALCWGVFGLTVFPYGVISILGFSFLILSLGYALVCWNRIPFCSTNLYTAICAMRSTTGILLVGIGSLWVALLWCLVWAVAVMGIFNTNNSVDCQLRSNCETHMGNDRSLELAILILSFYWTNMVIKNVVRVTVAGAIGAWWFVAPRQAHCCCDSTVWGPLGRACSNSLGSICLGSLMALPAQTISVLGTCFCWVVGAGHYNHSHDALVATKPTKKSSSVGGDDGDDDDDDHRNLTNECSGMMDRLARQLRSYNRWSYTYIGMYGYSFAQGGEKAIQLFETREWMDIVRDNLIQNILFMASIVIGGSTGTFSVLVEEVDGYTFTSLNQPIMTAFWIGSIFGFVLSNILLLGVVGSAVNTILVCFAADPFEFDKNHPRLSREMREVWSQQVWEPNEEAV